MRKNNDLRTFLRLLSVSLLVIVHICASGQQIIKGFSKPTAFNIQPSKDSVVSSVKLTTEIDYYKNERKTALIIGNGAYKTGPLKNAVNDALDIAASLSGKGFKVILKQNATKLDMKNGIREFGAEIAQGGVGLFYYSGHGIQVDGSNYLVPLDADVQMKAEVEEECINANAVLRVMEFSDNRINVIILDACRNNPFRSFSRGDEKGITRMDPPKGAKQGSIIAFATAPGSVASDGVGRNGLYTSKLLKYINQPELTLEEVFKRVRIEVSTDSDGKQVPWENNSLTGDFYFTVK